MITSAQESGTAVRLGALLLGLSLLAALVIDQRPWDGLLNAEPLVGIVVDGERFQVPADAAGVVAQRSVERADNGVAWAADATNRLIADELDTVFESLSERLPDYADWYFSLRGEYTRISLLLLRWGGFANVDPVADRALELVFGGDELVRRVTVIEHSVEDLLGAHARELRSTWLEELLALARQEKPASSETSPAVVLVLDDVAAEFAGHGSSDFLGRVSASSAGAVSAGFAAPLVARLALRSAQAAGGGALILKGAGRGATKAGSVGAGALGCAAAGPAGWACALAVGGAAWLATDWALLTFEEWRNREALLADWEDRLAGLRTELEQALLAHYGQEIEVWRQGMHREVERTFSPLDSLRDRSGGQSL